MSTYTDTKPLAFQWKWQAKKGKTTFPFSLVADLYDEGGECARGATASYYMEHFYRPALSLFSTILYTKKKWLNATEKVILSGFVLGRSDSFLGALDDIGCKLAKLSAFLQV